MKITYSKQHKQAAIEHIRENNPHVKDPELTMDRLIQSAVSEDMVTSVSSGGIHVSVSMVFNDEVMLDFYVSPCFDLEYEYVTETVKIK